MNTYERNLVCRLCRLTSKRLGVHICTFMSGTLSFLLGLLKVAKYQVTLTSKFHEFKSLYF